jgi:regulator of sigma E protease
VATTDPDNPDRLRPLPADPQDDLAYRRELHDRWQRLAGRPMTVQLRRAGAAPGDTPVEIRTEPGECRFGDVIVATTDPDRPGEVTPLPPDVHNPGSGLPDYFAFARRQQRLAGEFLTVRVKRTSGEEADLIVPPAYHVTLGARMSMGAVSAVREGSPAQQAGVAAGDLLQEVVLKAGDQERHFVTAHKKGETAADLERFVDPLRLPDELRGWAEGKQGVKATLIVFRTDPATREERGKPQALPEVAWDGSDLWRFDREEPVNLGSPVAVPELGVAYKVETTVERGGAPAEGQERLEQDDVIKQVRLWTPGKQPGESEADRWQELGPDQWAWVMWVLQQADFPRIGLQVERKKKPAQAGAPRKEAEVLELEVVAQPDVTWPTAERGFLLKQETRLLKADHVWDAITLGLQDTYDQILDVFYHLRSMVSGRISPTNIGGPLTIGVAAFDRARVDFWEFLFFLGMISVNLAVINFLPIPVLDGGHMVFLAYEKLRGRPASEQVRVAATYAGLLFIVSLMFFVFYQDIKRIWF